MKTKLFTLLTLLLCLGSSGAWADPTYKNIASDTKVFPTSYSDLSAAITEGWISTTSDNFSNKGASINPQTGEAYGSATNIASKVVKAGNDKKTIKFYVTNVSAIRVYGANGGSGSRRIKVTATPSDASGATTSYGTAAGSGVTQVINMNLTSSKSYEIDITGVEESSDTGADCAFQGIWFTSAGAANAPVNPTFTPDGGSIEGNSTVTVASTYAQKIFYYWSDISTAPSQGDASYTEAEGASAEVTAPNEVGTKYLHAYGWNNKNTNTYTSTITKTFTITEGKELPGLEYAVAEVAKYTTDANFTNALTNPHSLAVTYSVVAGATATGVEVNETTGEVSIGSVEGTATIKASFAGNEDYLEGEATYVLTVTKPTCDEPTYTIGNYNYEQRGYAITPACETTGATLTWKMGSGDETACTVGVPFYTKGGKVVLTASKEGWNSKSTTSSNQWTINAAPSDKSPEVLLPFGTSNDTSDKNVAHVYKSVTIGENNSASSVGGSGGGTRTTSLKVRTNQTHDAVANSIVIYVHSGYTVTNLQIRGVSNNSGSGATIIMNGVYVDNKETKLAGFTNTTFPISSADAVTYSTGTIAATDYILLTFDNSNITGESNKKNNQLYAEFTITYTAPDVTVTRSATTKTLTSFCSTQPLNFSTVSSKVEAYIASEASSGTAKMKKVTDVPAYTGLVLKWLGDDTNCNIPVGTATSLGEDNMLVGTTVATNLSGLTGYNYVLSANEFHPISSTNTTLPANKAYLHSADDAAGARMLSIVFDDEETTGISDATRLNDNGQLINDGYFDLQGRKVAQPTKGLYIVNGRKVVIK